MASRAVANVVISLGMVHIAVKLYLAASADRVNFSMINAPTKNRISQKLVDKETGEEVLRSDLLKGYEYAKDQFVCFTEEEISNLQAAKKDTLEISEFIPVSEIDPLHVEKTYYTGPNKGMDKAYMILYRMLKDHNRSAVGTWVSHGKEHLVVIRAYEHGIIMHQMFYNTEVRAFDNMCASNVVISPIELAMGKVLMDTLFHEKFDKSKYSDHFVEKITAAIQTKLNGGTITAVAAKTENTGMVDALRASLVSMGVPKDKIIEMLSNGQMEVPESKAAVVEEKSKRTRTRKVAKAS